jgi:hypothetical protein
MRRRAAMAGEQPCASSRMNSLVLKAHDVPASLDLDTLLEGEEGAA